MAGTSNFPRALDTDTNLERLIGGSALQIADHNNLVDALESVEPTVGVVDDGTAYGGQAFNRGLTDHVGLMTTAGPNGRYPWLPRPAGSWYGTDAANPVSWTISGGLAPSYGPPQGPIKIAVPNDGTKRYMVVNLPGATPFHFQTRWKAHRDTAHNWSLWMGFSILGTEADISGALLVATNQISPFVAGAAVGTVQSLPLSGVSTGWIYLWGVLSGGTFTLNMSVDGMCYSGIYMGASALVATKFVIGMQGNASAVLANTLWLDYVTFGNVNPQGQ